MTSLDSFARCLALSTAIAACGASGKSALDAGEGSALDGAIRGADAGLVEGGAPPIELGPIAELCDGSDAIRLGFRILCPARYDPGTTFLHSNGEAILLVHGDCHFSITQYRYMLEVRSGELSATQAEQLAMDLHFGQWAAIAGEFHDNTASDVCANDFVDFEGNRIVCSGGDCGSPAAAETNRNIHAWFDRLWTQAAPLETTMRVGAVLIPADVFEMNRVLLAPVRWELAPKLADFAADAAKQDLSTKRIDILIDDAQDVAKLRSIRARALNKELKSYNSYGAVTVSSNPEREHAPVYWLYFRDVLPEENAEGILVVP